jgi:hypothetical protein
MSEGKRAVLGKAPLSFFVMLPFAAAVLLALMKPAFAQFPAPPEGRKVLESRFGEGGHCHLQGGK